MAAMEDAIAPAEVAAVASLLLPQEAELPSLSLPQEVAVNPFLPQAAVASSLLAARASQRSNNCRAKQGLGLGEPTPPCVHQVCTGNPVSE